MNYDEFTNCMRLEVLKAVKMPMSVFWIVMLYGLRKIPTFWRNILHPSSAAEGRGSMFL
jgi:hypothetical protein